MKLIIPRKGKNCLKFVFFTFLLEYLLFIHQQLNRAEIIGADFFLTPRTPKGKTNTKCIGVCGEEMVKVKLGIITSCAWGRC